MRCASADAENILILLLYAIYGKTMNHMPNIRENRLNRIISEAVRKVINEGTSVVDRFSELVNSANEAYRRNVEEFGEGWSLMDNEAECYGLSSDIRVLGNGYIVFPFTGWQYSPYNGPIRIRTFSKAGGKATLYKDELHYSYDYRDAKKLLKQVISDAERYRKDMEGYDPNWEDKEDGNPKAIRDFNKSIGVRAGARKPY